MGTLVLLALARLFAPTESGADPTEPSTEAAAINAVDAVDAEALHPLRVIDFKPQSRTLRASQPAFDLRDPFRTSDGRDRGRGSNVRAPAPTRRRVSARRPDLRDPFAEPTHNHRAPGQSVQPDAEDLRDPFNKPAPALPKCPDTGGVPIQRPNSVKPRCLQASRPVFLVRR